VILHTRLRLLCFSVLGLSLGIVLPTPPGHAAGLLDVPLRSWSSFEPYRDWTYAAVERLVNAGLVGPWVLNTKPMSRMEMARVVTVALRKIQEDQTGRFARRSDLEPILYNLMEELAPELEAMAVRTGADEFAGQPWVDLRPISRIQARAYAVRRDARPENAQGLRLDRLYDGTVGFASYMQVGDFMSVYLHPEFQMAEHRHEGQLLEGYLKLKFNNLSVRFGRESVWWGPGYHGSMLFGNNAPPLNQVRIATAEPIILPGFLRALGPTRLELLVARLEADRDFPHALIGAWRLDVSPFPFLELGAARMVQFGGQGRPRLRVVDYPWIFVRSSDQTGSKFQTNQIYSLDATVRLHDVDRIFPLSRDLTVYTEIGVDDTCCQNVLWPLKPAYLVGLYLPNLLGRSDTELRVEWATTTSVSFSNNIYTTGYSSEGFPLAHFIGTRGQDLYIRTAERILPNVQIGAEFDLAKVGPTTFAGVTLPREERKFVGLDVTYQPTRALSMLLGYRYERIDNKDFIADQRATNHIFRLEASYSFPVWERAVYGRPRRAEAFRPITPPPAPRAEQPPEIDPDELVSAHYLRRLFQDTGTILTSPLRWETRDWLVVAGVGLTAGGLMFADHGVRNYLQKKRTDDTADVSQIFRPFGSFVPAALVAGIHVTGHAFDLPKLKAASADALEASLITAGVFVTPLKFFTGRSRPDVNEGSAQYEPLHLGTSLPSFTTAHAFSVASVLSEHFPHPALSVLAYGLAGAVGLTRIHDDKHWTSDVFLAAAIGTAVGKTVVKLNEGRRRGSRVNVVPLLGEGIQGAALQVEF
jgi:membrane-associated phospholipid phosphatase/opacity protein-like surface antigen